jgi:uncharacterized protein YecE (DUF72 family)
MQLVRGRGLSAARALRWAEWLHAQRRSGFEIYAYFNNDVGGHVPRDAMTLRRLLEARA